MTGRIEIGFAPAEGAVLRMLGVVERRGFELRAIAMSEEGGRGSLAIDVRARDAGRRLDVVAGQLRRLHEVQTVTTQEGSAQ
jgi:acetolactate synthase-1/3 small subunit/acetolactate synthase II small subunit